MRKFPIQIIVRSTPKQVEVYRLAADEAGAPSMSDWIRSTLVRSAAEAAKTQLEEAKVE